MRITSSSLLRPGDSVNHLACFNELLAVEIGGSFTGNVLAVLDSGSGPQPLSLIGAGGIATSTIIQPGVYYFLPDPSQLQIGNLSIKADVNFSGLAFVRLVTSPKKPIVTIVPSAAYIGTYTGNLFGNYGYRGVYMAIGVSAAGTGTVTPAWLQYIPGGSYDPGTGTFTYTQIGSPISAKGNYFGYVYPAVSLAGAGPSSIGATSMLPAIWRPALAHSDSSSWTYSVSFTFIE